MYPHKSSSRSSSSPSTMTSQGDGFPFPPSVRPIDRLPILPSPFPLALSPCQGRRETIYIPQTTQGQARLFYNKIKTCTLGGLTCLPCLLCLHPD